MEILRCKDLSFAYNTAEQAALENINISLEQGDFLLLAGANGCGKSTFLRLLKKEIAPFGKKEGKIFFKGEALEKLSEKESVQKIGYVGRDCMLTSEYVSSQLVFILESLNVPSEMIRLKAAEICAEFGMEKLFAKPIDKLSGGEKQKVALASVLIAEPELLLLDEPISSLDPVAAADFLALLQAFCRRRNMTVIIAEHSLDSILPLANKILLLQDGRQLLFTDRAEIAAPATPANSANENYPQKNINNEAVAKISELSFRYERHGENILQELELGLTKGSCTALLGANGCGKSTLLKLLAGSLKVNEGKIRLCGKAFLLPQQAGDIFSHSILKDELEAAAPQNEWLPLVQRFRLENQLESHFLDLSGGELQKAALIRILLKKPSLLLLDEPTLGLDLPAANELAQILRELSAEGMAICFATHDMQFCSVAADTGILLFNKEIACQMPIAELFAQSSYYSAKQSDLTKAVNTLLYP